MRDVSPSGRLHAIVRACINKQAVEVTLYLAQCVFKLKPSILLEWTYLADSIG